MKVCAHCLIVENATCLASDRAKYKPETTNNICDEAAPHLERTYGASCWPPPDTARGALGTAPQPCHIMGAAPRIVTSACAPASPLSAPPRHLCALLSIRVPTAIQSRARGQQGFG